MKANVVVFI